MFNHQPTKMAPTDNVPAFSVPETNNLLSFVSSATVNIHEALGKQSKKRTVNIKKYAQKRVKRLDGSSRKGNTAASVTKSKSALLSPPFAKKQVNPARAHASLVKIGPSSSWPELPLPARLSSAAPQTSGVATTNYSTYVSHPPMQHSLSDPNLYPPTTNAAGIEDDVDLAAILSEFNGLPVQEPVSSRHTSGSVTPCFTPQPTLESQVGIGEYPYSPYSDCGSEDFNDDSAYSSPTSYSHSPAPPMTSMPSGLSSTDWTTSAHSPPMVMAQCSLACSSSWMEMPTSLYADPPTVGCSWIPECSSLTTVNAPMPAVIDQGPPATPTVLQFLSEFGPFQ